MKISQKTRENLYNVFATIAMVSLTLVASGVLALVIGLLTCMFFPTCPLRN